MIVQGIKGALQNADEQLCKALDDARRLSDNPSWQDCAETTEAESSRLRADIAELRGHLVDIQRRYRLS